MKFLLCTLVVCALSMTAHSSVAPLALGSPLLYSAVHGPGVIIDNSQPIVVPYAAASAFPLYHSPLFVSSPIGLKAEGTYVAKTPGSEHIASLPGHYTSASSINLEQAPGSNKDKVRDSSSLAPSVAIHGSVIPAAFPQLIVPAPIVVPSEATYVAKNRGIEHIAPLPGHSISALSLNLQPAPGSK